MELVTVPYENLLATEITAAKPFSAIHSTGALELKMVAESFENSAIGIRNC